MRKMKKTLAAMMAATMVLSMNMTAWAENLGEDGTTEITQPGEDGKYGDAHYVTIKKKYVATNESTVSPKETFNFEIQEGALFWDEENAELVGKTIEDSETDIYPAGISVAAVEYEKGDASVGGKEKNIVVTLPTYTRVGVYYYTIREKEPNTDDDETTINTAGVTYYPNDIILKVTVIEQDGKVRVAAVHTEEGYSKGESTGKKDEITNTYSAGSLAVKKIVTGNMGDQEKEFNVTVTFTAPEGTKVKEDITYTVGEEEKTVSVSDWKNGEAEAEIKLAHNDTITFKNIPYGVLYSVIEDDYTAEGYNRPDYAGGDIATEAQSFGEMNSNEESVEITNNKGVNVDTGVMLDSVPYIILLAVAACGVFFVARKKRDDEMF